MIIQFLPFFFQSFNYVTTAFLLIFSFGLVFCIIRRVGRRCR